MTTEQEKAMLLVVLDISFGGREMIEALRIARGQWMSLNFPFMGWGH